MKTIKRMTPVIFFLSFLLSFSSCDEMLLDETDGSDSTEQTDPDEGTDTPDEVDHPIIENQVFNETLIIDGHENDGLVIQNCTFEDITGEGLLIKTVNNLVIRNCTFRNISLNAIRMLHKNNSENVIIEDNRIYNIDWCGVLTYDTHANTVIRNNVIHDVGLKFDNPDNLHALYISGPNFTIEGNTIYDVKHVKGNAISVRSYGKISRNKIYNCKKNGIAYYSDHPGYGKDLVIENNILYDNDVRGVQLYDDGATENYIGKAIVRFNTIISKDNAPVGMVETFSNVGLEVYGNILVRTDGKSTYVYAPEAATTHSNNLEASGDVGFVDYSGRDFHLASGSEAIDFVVGIADFPEIDFEGNERSDSALDAGACERN